MAKTVALMINIKENSEAGITQLKVHILRNSSGADEVRSFGIY
jgi:hypothetical protein